MPTLSRRTLIKTLTVAGAAALADASFAQNASEIEGLTLKGNIRQSVSKWCFGSFPLAEFCKICKKLGLVAVDLIDPKDWDTVHQHGLEVSMSNVPGAGIPKGFNRIEHHDYLLPIYEALIPQAAEKKVKNLICFSGNRNGLDDDKGAENCVIGLKKLMPSAEKHGVNILMELLNSKGHKDYQADHTAWGGSVARKVGSERFKLLYDIYHMQRMDGDIIENIRAYKDVIGHYHTAGNPGRNDLDDTQELCYSAIARAIKDTGYKGIVAHEFLPKKGIESLRNAVLLCDV
ncbi:MAG: TIM barrel protein [Planctomycetaceae bacterium]|jgi:hydroxypyruvate isomerase|nr:TIM barrel protein [Planctomycetaceae bacterium]